jgi:hypothetical protein
MRALPLELANTLNGTGSIGFLLWSIFHFVWEAIQESGDLMRRGGGRGLNDALRGLSQSLQHIGIASTIPRNGGQALAGQICETHWLGDDPLPAFFIISNRPRH